MAWEIKDKTTATPSIGDYIPFQTTGGTTRKSTPIRVSDAACVSGDLYYDNATGTALALTAASTWYPINSSMSAGEFVVLTYSLGSPDSIVIPTGYDGLYEIAFHASYEVDSAGSYEFGLATNGTACARGCKARDTITAAGAKGLSVGARIHARLAAADVLSLQARNTAGAGTTLTYRVLGLCVTRIGD